MFSKLKKLTFDLFKVLFFTLYHGIMGILATPPKATPKK